MKFSELELSPTLKQSIDFLSYTECTPIQEQSIPPILAGKDVAGLAQTGTGKTAAFVIPLIERILRSRHQALAVAPGELGPGEGTPQISDNIKNRIYKDWRRNNFVLILVPTRELAEQVYENISSLGQHSGIRGFAIYGGTGYDKQKEALASGLDFIVATPGRLIDLYKEHLVDLKQVRAIVFDEADRMFDMGFKDDMKYILQRIPKDRQFLVFSATLNFDVLNTAYQFGSEPVEINISRDQATAENVQDEIYHVGSDEKPQHLISLLRSLQPKQTIIFSNFKHNVDRIAKFLISNDLPAMGISSLLSQAQRNKVIEQFKAENEHNILVATDVAARGLDIKGVDLVINYELPNDSESYVHRIGRTGRAGTTGRALSLVSEKDVESLERIESYLKKKLTVAFLETNQLVESFAPFQSGSDSYAYSSGGFGSGKGGRRDRHERGNQQRPGRGPKGKDSFSGARRDVRGDYRDAHSTLDSRNPSKVKRRDGTSSAGNRSRPNYSEAKDTVRSHSTGASFDKNKHSNRKPMSAHSKESKSGAKGFGRSKTTHPSGNHKHGAHSKASPGLIQKVSGFFKKLFGS